MFSFLKPAERPVIDALEKYEIFFAKNQPEYSPLRALSSNTKDGRVMSRWALTPELRKAIAEGADIFITQLTFGKALQPISVAIGDDPDPTYFREKFNLGVGKITMTFIVFGDPVKVEVDARLPLGWAVIEALASVKQSNVDLQSLELRTQDGYPVSIRAVPAELMIRD